MNREALNTPISFVEFIPEGNGFYPIDREVKVEPLTDAKIGEISRAQRMEVLNERRFAYARPELESSFVIPLEEVRPETLELATTVIDVRSRDWEIGYYSSRLEDGKKEYEAEKAAIRSGKRGKKGIEKKVASLASQWQARTAELKATISSLEEQKETTIDGFIKSTLLTPGGVNAFLLASQDLEEQSYFFTSDSIDLLKKAQERLRTIDDPEEIKLFSYKAGLGNLITEDQALSIKELMGIAFSPSINGVDLKKELQSTAKELVELYWENSAIVSFPGDQTPTFGFMYDALYGSYLNRDSETVFEAVRYFRKKIDSDVEKIKPEYKRLLELHYQGHFDFISEIENDMHAANFRGSNVDFIFRSGSYFDKWDPIKRGAVSIDLYIDRSMAMNSFNLLSKFLGGKDYHYVLSDGKRRSKEEEAMVVDYAKLFEAFDFQIFKYFPDSARRLDIFLAYLLGRESYGQSIQKWTEQQKIYTFVPSSLPDKASRQRFIRDAAFEWGFGDKGLAILSMFYDRGLNTWEDIIRVSSENSLLIDRIKNSNLWFVAEQGDQFNSGNNPDLKELNIKSITFIPQPDNAGHSVEIDTDLEVKKGEPIKIELSITGNGEILWKDGRRIELQAWGSEPFKNFILRRLHFITSGALGERGNHGKGEVENGEATVRRSHWRILNSTPERKITLNSPQAKAHAEYVRETYGIDIYEENLRRKLAGTLGENQVLTFVRAVKGKSEPNQLMYKEELINLNPIAN